MSVDPLGGALVELAGWDLGLQPRPIDPALLSHAGIDRCKRQNLIGVLAGAVAVGALDIDDGARAVVAAAHRAAMAEVLLLDRELIAALAVLDAASIEYRVLKGVALAQTICPDPSERCYGDIDLVVPARQIDEAVKRLEQAGAIRPQPPLSADFDRRFAKSVTLKWRNGTELDVHRTLAPGPYGIMVRLEDLFVSAAEFELGPRTALTLPLDLQLVHGALHVALGDYEPRLGNLRDVALLLGHPGIDPDRVIRTAKSWRVSAPVALGLQKAATLGLPDSELSQWAAAATISTADQRRMATYRKAGSRFRGQVPQSLLALPGWADRLAYSRAVVIPRRDALAQRGLNRWQYMKSRLKARF